MSDEAVQALRRKAVGTLLRNARLEAGRSRTDCARLLGCSSKTVASFEEGETGMTVTQLEVLAQFLGVPAAYFWQETAPPESRSDEVYESPAMLRWGMELRRKLLAVQVRQVRLAAGKTQKECARQLGCSVNRYHDYETGKRDIPLADLETISAFLGMPLSTFLCDEDGKPYDYVMGVAKGLGLSQASSDAMPSTADLRHLSPEIRAFVAKPVNTLYLLLALKLSLLPVSSLRQIGESLLEITY